MVPGNARHACDPVHRLPQSQQAIDPRGRAGSCPRGPGAASVGRVRATGRWYQDSLVDLPVRIIASRMTRRCPPTAMRTVPGEGPGGEALLPHGVQARGEGAVAPLHLQNATGETNRRRALLRARRMTRTGQTGGTRTGRGPARITSPRRPATARIRCRRARASRSWSARPRPPSGSCRASPRPSPAGSCPG